MFTSIAGYAGAVAVSIATLTGGAVLGDGAAVADPDQDEQFLTLLDQEEIPAVENRQSVIATAHKVCGKLDGGMPVDALVDEMKNFAYSRDRAVRQYPPDRVTRTMTRFITAAVQAYCPGDRGKIASIMANPGPGSNEPTHHVATQVPHAISPSDLRRPALDSAAVAAGRRAPADGVAMLTASVGAVPSGEITPTDPSPIPSPPPTAHVVTPRLPAAAPHPSKQSPPPLKEPPPPPQQVPPPANGPAPGDASGGGTGGNGGNGSGGAGGAGGGGAGGPAGPAPTPPRPPGFVRLAP